MLSLVVTSAPYTARSSAMCHPRRKHIVERGTDKKSPTRYRNTVSLGEDVVAQIVANDTSLAYLQESISISKTNLLSIQLTHCGLQSAQLFSVCFRLRELDISDNDIAEVPSFEEMETLRILKLDGNRIRSISDVRFLSSRSDRGARHSLIYLRLTRNPVSSLTSYRRACLNQLPRLLGLDDHIVLTLERKEALKESLYSINNFPEFQIVKENNMYQLRNQTRYLDLSVPEQLIMVRERSDHRVLLGDINTKINCLHRMYYTLDPIVKIQLFMRRTVHERCLSALNVKVIKLQAAFRGKRLRARIDREMAELLLFAEFEEFQSNASPKKARIESLGMFGFYARIIVKYCIRYKNRMKRKRAAQCIQRCARSYMQRSRDFIDFATRERYHGFFIMTSSLKKIIQILNTLCRAKRFAGSKVLQLSSENVSIHLNLLLHNIRLKSSITRMES